MAGTAKAYLDVKAIRMPTAFDLELNATALTETGGDYVAGQIMRLFNRYGGENTYILAQCRNGSTVVQGELMSKIGDATGYTAAGSISGGSTTTAITSGLTADDHEGAILRVLDNADSAGAAPEGESSIVSAQTATLITVDSDLPFSAAIASSDTADLLGVYACADAASNDESVGVLGIVVGEAGIADNSFGFLQCAGVNPQTLMKASTGHTRGGMMIADTARVTAAAAASPAEDIIGQFLVTTTSDIDNDICLTEIGCGYSRRMYSIGVENDAA